MIIGNLECMVMYTGEPTFNDCVASIVDQTVKASKTFIVKDFFPLNESINERHRRMEKEISIKVDADMILYPDCFKILFEQLKVAGENYWGISAMLLDPFLGEIGGVHIQRSEHLKNIRVPNVIGCDRWLAEQMKDKGYLYKEVPIVVGVHKSDWSLEAIFKRQVRVGQKHAYFGSAKYEDIVGRIKKKWDAGDQRAYLALIGYCYGLLVSTKEEKGKDFMQDEWERISRLIDKGIIPISGEKT